MERLISRVVPVLAAWAMLWAGSAAAQPPRPSALAGIPSHHGGFLLGTEPVQKELNLSDAQIKRLQEINANFVQESQVEWAAVSELPPDQQRAKAAEVEAKLKRRSADVRKEMESLLTPQQAAHLKTLSFAMVVMTALNDPRIVDELAFSAEQRQKLQQIHNDAQSRFWQVQKEVAEKNLELLTPEQRRKIEEVSVGDRPLR